MWTQFISEFKTQKGTQWKLSIINTEVTSTIPAVSLTMSRPAFTLEYQQDTNDVIIGGFVPSTLSAYCLYNTTAFKSWVMNTFYDSEEGTYILRLDKWDGGTYTLYWAGIIFNDFAILPDSDNSTITLTAVDGISQLKGVDFETTGGTPAESFLQVILKGLGTISTEVLWGSGDTYLISANEWVDSRIVSTTDPLDSIMTDLTVFRNIEEFKGYNGALVKNVTNMDWIELIEHILIAFDLRLFLARGRWNLIQIKLQSVDDLSYFEYQKVYVVSTTSAPERIDINVDGIEITRAQSQFSFFPALKKVTVRYLSEDGGNILPTPLALNTTYTLRTVTTGTGNYLSVIGVNYLLIQGILTSGISDSTPFWKLTIKVGSKYYTNAGWSSSVGYYIVKGDKVQFANSLYDQDADRAINSYAKFSFNTADIQASGSVEFKIELDYSQGTGLDEVNGRVIIEELNQSVVMYFIVANEGPADYVETVAENNKKATLEYKPDDILFGSSGTVSCKGFLQTLNGTEWGDCGLWEVSGETPTLHHDQLLAREILGRQTIPALHFSGLLIRVDGRGDFLSNYRLTYGSYTYTLIMYEVRYEDDVWSGDWISIAREIDPITLSFNKFDTAIFTRASVTNTMTNLLGELVNAYTGEITTKGGKLNTAGATEGEGGDIETDGGDILAGAGGISAGGTIVLSGAIIELSGIPGGSDLPAVRQLYVDDNGFVKMVL